MALPWTQTIADLKSELGSQNEKITDLEVNLAQKSVKWSELEYQVEQMSLLTHNQLTML
jgi:hypothetical protein